MFSVSPTAYPLKYARGVCVCHHLFLASYLPSLFLLDFWFLPLGGGGYLGLMNTSIHRLSLEFVKFTFVLSIMASDFGESAHCQVLVVPAQDSGAGERLQNRAHWKAQQKLLWAKVRKETGRGKNRLKSGTSSLEAVLDFLSATDVERLVPTPAEENAQSETPEWEPRERREGEEEKGQEA